MSTTAPLAFIDTETTHLSAEIGEVWELAAILRDPDGAESEHVWQFRPLDPSAANPESLKIGRYEDRFVVPDDCGAAYITGGDIDPMTRTDAITEVMEILRGAVLIGSNAAFDDRFLRKLVGLGNHQWHYRPVCVATLAAGFLYGALTMKAGGDRDFFADDYPAVPFKSYDVSESVGIKRPSGDVAHTALGDAAWAKAVYDAVTGGGK